jgi:hypothetical protein
MIRTRAALTALALTALLAPATRAQEAASPRHVPLQKSIGQVTPTGPVPSLYVLNADGASLAEGKLTLSGVSPNSIVFADRPVRAAGHLTTAQLIEQWDTGKDNFAIDPPNATVSVLGGTGSDISDAVVTLTRPVLTGDTLVFDVRVLEGALRGAGPAAVFIDDRGDGSASPELGNQAAFDSAGGEGGVDNNYDSPVASGSGSFYHQPVLQGAWYRTHDPDNAGMNDFQYGAGASIPFDSSE